MPASNPADFFKQKRTTAEIKAEIGLAFFRVWCDLHLSEAENTAAANTATFLDLNAGSGLDAAGKALTPVKALEIISESAATATDLNKLVRTVFTDGNKAALNKLRENLEALNLYAQLKHPPIILDETGQTEFLSDLSANAAPTLMLVDPFSYKWAQEVFANSVQQGHSDLLLVFDFAKLQKAVQPEQVNGLRDFWANRWQAIQDFYLTIGSPVKREKFVIDQFALAFQDNHYHPLAFKINAPDRKRTSHYIFFASRNTAAYLKMKELLQLYSDWQIDAVPLFGANLQHEAPAIPEFFKFSHPFCMENLVEELAQKKKSYHFQCILQVYEDHSPGTNYVLQNYLTAFTTLRDRGHINILNSSNKQVKSVTSASIIFYKLHSTGAK